MSRDDANRARRERSTRYPGAPLAECVEFCRVIDTRGLDGLPASAIAAALGYKNAKTNTFSARLSAARQFGLLGLTEAGYTLTPLARSILHPVDPSELPGLYRRALREPPLYAELAQRLADRRLPEAPILANLLYHHHGITASAKLLAAESFLASVRFAGALDDEGIFRPEGGSIAGTAATNHAEAVPLVNAAAERPPASTPPPRRSEVRLDLRLWGPDEGKVIRLRAPEAITAASFERFLQTFRLLVRIEPGESG
ncbi:MAG: hypothetical protein IRY99_14315 [Isosphaeraceae bacterium]|nr:hypothetical protein [Isosphaeraceae bacterium]